MRIRTSLSIVVLVGAVVAVPLYFLTEPERTTESPDIPGPEAQSPLGAPEPRSLYCAQRTPANGVVVSTGAECAPQDDTARPDLLTLTITREPDALVITGSDP